MSDPVVIPVTAGTFECPHCDALWIGSWRGDPELMTCPRCEKKLTKEDDGVST